MEKLEKELMKKLVQYLQVYDYVTKDGAKKVTLKTDLFRVVKDYMEQAALLVYFEHKYKVDLYVNIYDGHHLKMTVEDLFGRISRQLVAR